MDTKIMKALYSVLSQFEEKYFISGDLNKSKVIEDIDKYDENLVLALLKDPLVRKHYSKNLGEYTIIETNKLIETFEMDDFWMDSHTKYTKKIGLTSRGRFIDESTEVVLDFPYKDTVLKAGMSKEDVKKDDLLPNEPFYNEVIASEEIDVMLDKKILVNAKRYTANGAEDTTEFSESDNLILKGNNLLGLHTLKDKYGGKVKFIYIDVPYNTGSDSFKYNDKFNQSAWLTFIKNRVEVAQDFLSDDGVILIQISFHQYPYLRVLLDDVLGRNYHIMDINTLVRHPQRTLTGDKEFNDVVEHTLIYSKNSKFKMPKIAERKTEDKYKFQVSITGNPTETRLMGKKEVEIYLPDSFEISKVTPSSENLHRETVRGSIREKNSSGRFYVAHLEKLRDEFPPLTLFKVPDMGDDSLGFRYFELPKEGNKNGAYYQGMPQSSKYTYTPYPNFLDYVEEYNSVNEEGGYEYRNGKKPESYIENYMKMFTVENDLVMDFFMGSGTTQSVALKTKRQFIGIEQLEDTMQNVTLPRLRNVLSGDETGISKDVDWQGGGSFIYAELMEKSQGYIDSIYKAKDSVELRNIYHLMLDNVDINFRVDLQVLEEILEEEPSLDERKKLLLKVIDKNQLYYNYSEIDDVNVRDLISDTDYAFNRSFYKEDDILG